MLISWGVEIIMDSYSDMFFRDNPTKTKTVIEGDYVQNGIQVPLREDVMQYFSSVPVSRFSPYLFTSNGPRSTVSCPISSSNNITFNCFFTKKNDLVGLIWNSADTLDHNLLKYETNIDYTDCILKFDLILDDKLKDLDDPVDGLTLTLIHADGINSHIRLANYAKKLGTRKWQVELNFNTIKAGFSSDKAINARNIERLFIPVVPVGFNASANELLTSSQNITIQLNNISCNQTIMKGTGHVPEHSLGMCTSYDDSATSTPERILTNLYSLGYRGLINHYVGMSTFPNRQNVNGKMTVAKDENTYLINNASREWHIAFTKEALKRGMTTMFSLSYELFSDFCPIDWAQRDWDGNLSVTGYTPPSHLLSPCVPEAMNYLREVFVEFGTIQNISGQSHCILQVGEPWWWFNPKTGQPCIYDYPTKLKFFNDTGMYAPKFKNIQDTLNTKEAVAYKKFLKDTLGESVLSFRTYAKQKLKNVSVTALFFLPSILSEEAGIMKDINYPEKQYRSPNLDFFMTEAYDWVVVGKQSESEAAFKFPIINLGYTEFQSLHYLAGFVPDESLADAMNLEVKDGYLNEMWSNVIGSCKNAAKYSQIRTYIWAYPQIMRDSITVTLMSQFNYFFSGKTYIESINTDNKPKFTKIKGA